MQVIPVANTELYFKTFSGVLKKKQLTFLFEMLEKQFSLYGFSKFFYFQKNIYTYTLITSKVKNKNRNNSKIYIGRQECTELEFFKAL